MAVKVQRATAFDPFACHVHRRGGQVTIGCGRIASACVLAGWASSRPLAPPALSTFCSMMVRFTPRLATDAHLCASARAHRVDRTESRDSIHCVDRIRCRMPPLWLVLLRPFYGSLKISRAGSCACCRLCRGIARLSLALCA